MVFRGSDISCSLASTYAISSNPTAAWMSPAVPGHKKDGAEPFGLTAGRPPDVPVLAPDYRQRCLQSTQQRLCMNGCEWRAAPVFDESRFDLSHADGRLKQKLVAEMTVTETVECGPGDPLTTCRIWSGLFLEKWAEVPQAVSLTR